MFPNRAPVPPGSGSSYKLSIPETCDRIKEEFSYFQQQTHNFHVEREKIIQERSEMQRLCIMYYEMAHGLNLEMHRQMEIAKRLNAILNQLIPYLSQEHQSQITSAIDRAKQVTMQELNSAMMHTEEAKCSKFFNGGNFGFPDQLEFYKHMLNAAANLNNPNGAGASSSNTTNSSNNNNNNNISNSINSNNNNTNCSLSSSSTNPGNNSMITSSSFPMNTGGGVGPSLSSSGIPPPPLSSTGGPLGGGSIGSGLPSSISGQLPPPPPPPPLPGSGANNSASANSLAANAANFFANLMAGAGGSGPFNLGNTGGPGVPNQLANNPAAAAAAANFFLNASAGGGNMPPGAAVPPNMAGINYASAMLKQEADKHLNDDKKNSSFSRPPSANDKMQNLSNHISDNHEKRRKLDIKSELKDEDDHYDDKRCTFNGNGKLKDHDWRHSDNLPISPRSVGSSTPGLNKKKMSKNALDLSQGPGGLSGVMTGVTGGVMSHDGYPTTCSAPATPATSGGGGLALGSRSDTLGGTVPPSSTTKSSKNHSKSFSQSTKKHYNFVVKPNGQMEPRVMPIDSSSTNMSQYPQQLRHLSSFNHGEVVCAVAMHHNTVYSGGKGTLKLWDVNEATAGSSCSRHSSSSINSTHSTSSPAQMAGSNSREPLASLSCLNSDSYIRSIKLINGLAAVIGGETNIVDIWDMAAPGSPIKKAEVKIDAPACYALTVAPDGKTCFSCFSDGNIAMIDVHNQTVINQFQAHAEGASCIEISQDGNYLWTGGLDSVVRAWDIRDCARELRSVEFHAQIFSIGLMPASAANAVSAVKDSCGPASASSSNSSSCGGGTNPSITQDWLAVGLENSDIDLVRVSPLLGNQCESSSPPPPLTSFGGGGAEHYRLQLHDNCVLSLRFAHHNDWFVTTSKDHLINAITCPSGINILQTKEAGSVLTSDISADDKYVVTGSGDRKATLYDVIYPTSNTSNNNSSSSATSNNNNNNND